MNNQCVVCHKDFEEEEWIEGCPDCRLKYPSSLLKAVGDPFDYALGLKDGTVIQFHTASINGDWVTLEGITNQQGDSPFLEAYYGHRFYRGIQIRFDQIIWCADAPDGS